MCSLTLLSGTSSFPFEEAAVAAAATAAAPALRVYIFFTQSSGIVHLFFKTQRGKEPCIICKHCIIGYVVQSLLYSDVFCSCRKTKQNKTKYGHTQALRPTSSSPACGRGLLLPASSLQLLIRSPLPTVLLTAPSSLLTPAPTTLLEYYEDPLVPLGCCSPWPCRLPGAS